MNEPFMCNIIKQFIKIDVINIRHVRKANINVISMQLKWMCNSS